MRRLAVQSEAVSSVGYDGKARTLAVEFREGQVYEYLEVPETIYRELLQAESIGNYVNTAIKPRFRVRPARRSRPGRRPPVPDRRS